MAQLGLKPGPGPGLELEPEFRANARAMIRARDVARVWVTSGIVYDRHGKLRSVMVRLQLVESM